MATDDFFRARLDGMVDMRHPLAVLASRMPWPQIEAALAPAFAHKDRKGRTVEGADMFGPTLSVAGAGVGACQGSCRSGHAASAVLFGLGRDGVLTTTSRSGFKATAPIGSQLRVWRDQRAGLRARAWRYSA